MKTDMMTPAELQEFYDYTASEVAEALGMSVNTVNRAQKSGLAKIAKALEERGFTAKDLLHE